MRPPRSPGRRARSLVLLLLVVVAPGACGSDAPDVDPVTDLDYTEAAEKLCAATLPKLRPDLSDDTPRSAEEIAEIVDDRAKRLDDLVDELETIPADEISQPEVEAWIEDWRAYNDVGRRYARALREEDSEGQADVAAEGNEPLARISTVARESEMPSCALDGVQLPPREGL